MLPSEQREGGEDMIRPRHAIAALAVVGSLAGVGAAAAWAETSTSTSPTSAPKTTAPPTTAPNTAAPPTTGKPPSGTPRSGSNPCPNMGSRSSTGPASYSGV